MQALSVTDGCRYGAVMDTSMHLEFRSRWSILLTSEKLNEGEKTWGVPPVKINSIIAGTIIG
jgi:hypothetical protein